MCPKGRQTARGQLVFASVDGALVAPNFARDARVKNENFSQESARLLSGLFSACGVQWTCF
jgi:hypothetical protein